MEHDDRIPIGSQTRANSCTTWVTFGMWCSTLRDRSGHRAVRERDVTGRQGHDEFDRNGQPVCGMVVLRAGLDKSSIGQLDGAYASWLKDQSADFSDGIEPALIDTAATPTDHACSSSPTLVRSGDTGPPQPAESWEGVLLDNLRTGVSGTLATKPSAHP